MDELVKAPEQEQVTNVAQAVTEVTESLDTKHKVLFYILMGLLVITPIGVVLLVLKLRKKNKENQQLTDQINAQAATQAPAAPAEETKTENPATTTEVKK